MTGESFFSRGVDEGGDFGELALVEVGKIFKGGPVQVEDMEVGALENREVYKFAVVGIEFFEVGKGSDLNVSQGEVVEAQML